MLASEWIKCFFCNRHFLQNKYKSRSHNCMTLPLTLTTIFIDKQKMYIEEATALTWTLNCVNEYRWISQAQNHSLDIHFFFTFNSYGFKRINCVSQWFIEGKKVMIWEKRNNCSSTLVFMIVVFLLQII